MESPKGGLPPARTADASLLHHHEAAGHQIGGVYSDGSIYTFEQEQYGGLAVRAVRRQQLWTITGIPSFEKKVDLWSAADRCQDKSKTRYLFRTDSLESDGLQRYSGKSACHPDRAFFSVRGACLPSVGTKQDAGTKTCYCCPRR